MSQNFYQFFFENTTAGGVFSNTSAPGLTNSDSYAPGDARIPAVLGSKKKKKKKKAVLQRRPLTKTM